MISTINSKVFLALSFFHSIVRIRVSRGVHQIENSRAALLSPSSDIQFDKIKQHKIHKDSTKNTLNKS